MHPVHQGISTSQLVSPVFFKYRNMNMDNTHTTLEHLIAERADKVLSGLEWYDTLDVQNAVKKAFYLGFVQGIEYHQMINAAEEIKDEVVVNKPKKKVAKSGKKK